MDGNEELKLTGNEAKKTGRKWNDCPKCGSTPELHKMRNFDPVAREGELWCVKCGAYVRDWDPN